MTGGRTDPGWAVAVDRERCIGSGMCVLYAPGAFEQDAEAKSTPVVPPAEDVDVSTVRTAVEACPTHALQLTIDGEA